MYEKVTVVIGGSERARFKGGEMEEVITICECPSCNRRIEIPLAAVNKTIYIEPDRGVWTSRKIKMIELKDILWVNHELAEAYKNWRQEAEKLGNSRW